MEKNNEVLKKIKNNESIFIVEDGGVLNINNSRLSSSGNTTKEKESYLYGLNSGIIAKEGSTVNIKNSTITTLGKGSNAIFSSGDNSLIDIDNVIIKTRGNYSNGLNAANKGTIFANDVSINTEGKFSSSILALNGEAVINVSNSTGITVSECSPCIYSKGNVVITDSNFKSEESEAAVVDGSSLVLNNTSISGSVNNGILLYKSNEENNEIGKCIFTSNLGSITAKEGAVFYVTNTEAIINLFNTKLNLSYENILINAKNDKWGKNGFNGGFLTLIGNHQTLKGNVLCDKSSSVNLKLNDYTYYTGALNAENLGDVSIKIDETSVWTLTGTSYIDYIIDENKELKNIIDNGYNIIYNIKNEKNNWLEGKSYNLIGGGKLIPA